MEYITLSCVALSNRIQFSIRSDSLSDMGITSVYSTCNFSTEEYPLNKEVLLLLKSEVVSLKQATQFLQDATPIIDELTIYKVSICFLGTKYVNIKKYVIRQTIYAIYQNTFKSQEFFLLLVQIYKFKYLLTPTFANHYSMK